MACDRLRDHLRRRRIGPDLASGRRGEDLAHRLLRRQGMAVVARNYRPPSGHGEIDLVAWDRGTLVFVEVKTRATEEYGAPDRAIDSDKREALAAAARDYARRAGVPWDRVRFDVVNVVLSSAPKVSHLQDAFRTGRALY